jgi:hypothetical protein
MAVQLRLIISPGPSDGGNPELTKTSSPFLLDTFQSFTVLQLQ